MRLIKKMALGLATVATAGSILHAGIMLDGCFDLVNKEKDLQGLINKNGYAEANEEHRTQQIIAIMQDYSMGKITEDEMRYKINNSNITELDIDTFAKNALSPTQYEEYQAIKSEEKVIGDKINGAGMGLIAAFSLFGVMSMGMAAGFAIEATSKRKHANNVENSSKNEPCAMDVDIN